MRNVIPGRGRARFALLLLVVAAAIGCRSSEARPATQVPGGDVARGRAAIGHYGCGACHVIPGIQAAEGHVGPPLTNFGRRVYIAGRLTNRPDSLVAWLMHPQAFEPGRAMPDMGVTERDARDIAAYLYTVR